MAVERLVQEYGLDRSAITIAPAGSQNFVGEEASGADRQSAALAEAERDDGALNGCIRVSVKMDIGSDLGCIREAFDEFGGESAA